jgi:hypothetical protein
MSLASVVSYFAPRRWRRRARSVAVPFAAAALIVACSARERPYFQDDADAEGETSVRFVHDGTLELKPSEIVTIEIETSPGEDVGVLFLGDALDASLDRSTARADEGGRASVALRAPSQPSTFRIRAQVGELAAELPVAVSEIGFADLRVIPKYQGKRSVDEGWVANVVVGSTCSEVLALLPSDPPGALRTTVDDPSEQPVVESVPVGPNVAVSIRSGAVVAGCSTLTLKTPGAVEETVVEVFDRPMELENAELDLKLGLEAASDPGSYTATIDAGVELLASSAFPAGYPLTDLLLDAMYESLPTIEEKNAFDAHRQSAQLDTTVAAILGEFDANAWCVSLGTQASSMALEDASSESSRIEGRLTGSPDSPETVSFRLDTWSGAPAADVGVPVKVALAWSEQPGDILLVSGTIPFSVTRLPAVWMRRTVSETHGPDLTVPEALGSDLGCELIGQAVAGFASCDAECGRLLCEAGLARRWQAGLDAGDAPDLAGKLEVGATGEVEVDVDVKPVSFLGSWVGTLTAIGQAAQVQGNAIGAAPPPG